MSLIQAEGGMHIPAKKGTKTKKRSNIAIDPGDNQAVNDFYDDSDNDGDMDITFTTKD
jgi:hypothetical protein